jgi:ribose transport system ATP-binding protein
MSSLDQWVSNLSGGNQQKVVLAKWLFRDTDVLIFDEPTRGIDVGAKYEIYLLLWKLANLGKAIIIVSSDLPEILGICHRILVFSNGKITGEVDRREFDQEKILSMAYQEYIKTIDDEQRIGGS